METSLARESALGKAATGAHGAVDKAAALADEAVRKAKPVIGRVADGAHLAVDKVAGAALPTAEWLSDKGETLNAARKKSIADARQYVAANPLKSVAIAVAAGVVISRILGFLR